MKIFQVDARLHDGHWFIAIKCWMVRKNITILHDGKATGCVRTILVAKYTLHQQSIWQRHNGNTKHNVNSE